MSARESPMGQAAGWDPDDGPDLCCPPWMQLTEAYVPYQPLRPRKVAPKEALKKGTLFPDLYRPYRMYGDPWRTSGHSWRGERL